MIPGGDPYGWGVFSVPMPHEVGTADPAGMPLLRLLTRDIPWRNVLFSVVMTCLVFASLLFLNHRQPIALVRPEPPPVEVTVMLRQEPRELPPPAVVTAPAPPRPQAPPPPAPTPAPPVVRQTPPPPPVVREMPPPKPRPLQQPPPVEAPLPQPAPLARLPERPAKPLSALPQRKAAVVVQPEAALPATPSLTPYQQKSRSASTTEMPPQATAFRAETAVTGLTVQPAPGRMAERAPTSQSLPKNSAALGRPAGAELNPVDTGLSQTRRATPSAAPAMPAAGRRQAVATGGGAETAIVAPQATGLAAAVGERAAAPTATLDQAPVAFAGGGAEERLSGPAAAVTPKGTAAASALPAGGSFDFLDLVAPSELDRSVLVSLNRLSTCRDPEAENRLKTRLAALLSQPAQCRAGGVIFAIRNPESAYSIHIDLYNYEQREFQDRCEALRLAVQACEARR